MDHGSCSGGRLVALVVDSRAGCDRWRWVHARRNAFPPSAGRAISSCLRRRRAAACGIPRRTDGRLAAADPWPLMPSAAIVHDFFVTDGGGESVAIELAALLPRATIYTTFFDVARFGDRIDPARVRTWPLQRIVGSNASISATPPPLSGLVLHTRSAPVRRRGGQFGRVHEPGQDPTRCRPRQLRPYPDALCMGGLDGYLAGSNYGRRVLCLGARAIRPLLRHWDRWVAQRPDILVANSATVQERIERVWGRKAETINPPVDVDGTAIQPGRRLSARGLSPLSLPSDRPRNRCRERAGPGPGRCRRWAGGEPPA